MNNSEAMVSFNRALYGTVRRRTVFFKALTGILAFQMLFFGMAPAAWALPGGLAGDSRVTTSGTTMTIHPNAGANAGSEFSWSSFNVVDGETVTIDAPSIHTAPSFYVAGRVDAGNNILVFKTSGGNIAVSGTINAGRFFAATFGSFDYENMRFTAQDVASGTIDITGAIPSGSVLVGHTITGSGAVGTVVGTSGMTPASEITIASGGGTITFKGVMGDASVLKAGTVNFEDNATANGTVDAGSAGTISGDFTQSGGTVNANEITGTLTQSGGEATANRIQALTQTAGTANTAEITGIANQSAGTINAGAAALTLGSGSSLGGTVMAGSVSVGNTGTLTLKNNAGLSDTQVTAGTLALDAGTEGITLNKLSVGTLQGTAGAINVTKTSSGALALGTINASSLSATTTGAGANITQSGATTISDNGNVTLNVGANTITLSQGVSGAGTLTLTSNNGTPANAIRVSGGTVSAETITLGGSAKTLSQSGGNITVSGANFLTGSDTLAQSGGSASLASSAAAVSQSGSGTINATTLSGTVTQNGGTIQANNATDGLTLSQAITTQNGTLSGNGGNVTVANGSTLSGTVNANTLNGNFTQAGGTINATTVAGTVSQDAGTIKNDNGSLTFQSAVTKNAGTIGSSSTAVTFNQNVTQSGSGTIIGNTVTADGNIIDNTGVQATTLVLGKADQAYGLGGANNNIGTLTSKNGNNDPIQIASVTINNGANQLTVKDIKTTGDLTVTKSGNLTLGSNADVGDRATVTDAGTVSFEGLKANTVVVTKAGAVTDTGDGLAAYTAGGTPTITLGQDATHQVAAVTLGNSAKLNVAGVQSSGAVSVTVSDSFEQSGDISGTSVSLTHTGGGIELGNVTATGNGAAGTVNVTTRGGTISQQNGTAITAPGAATFTAQSENGQNKYNVTVANDGATGNSFGSVGATGAAVQIGEKDATALNAISADSLIVTSAGAITQNGGITVTGDDGATTLNAGANKITLSQGIAGASGVNAGTLTLMSNTDVASGVTVSEIDANGKEFKQTGAGTIQVTGDNGIKAASIEQTANAGTIKAKKLDVGTTGTVTQNGGTINGAVADGGVEITGVLDQNAGTIDLGTGKLTLGANSTSGGTTAKPASITAGEIDAGTHTFTQDGAGTIKVSGDNGIKAATITQTADAGTIKVQKLDVGTTGTVTQNGGTINGTTENGNLTITGALDQNAGSVDLGTGTLTLGANSTSGGTESAPATITAGRITGNNVLLTQDGVSTIQASGTGTIALDVDVTQNDAGAVVGTTDTSVQLNKSFTQTAGKIEAATLTLNAANDYALESTGNNVATLSGTARSVTLDNTARTGKLTLSGLSVGPGDGNTVTVKKAADVELAGVTAKEIIVTEATGAVTDTDAQADIATTVTLGDAANSKTVGSVTLHKTKSLTLAGVNSAGAVTAKAATSLKLFGEVKAADSADHSADLALQGGAFTQNSNAVKGKNVTIDITGDSATTAVDGNITAKEGGDVLVKSAGAILIQGSGTTVASESGSIVVSGAKGVTVKEATLSATATGKGIGLKADDSTDGNTDDKVVVSDGATFYAETVVIDGEGGVEVGAAGNRVQMKKNTDSTTPDSSLVIVTDRDVKGRFNSNFTPSSDVKIYRAKKFVVSPGDTVELNTLALKTTDSIENFTFKGTQLALESKEGSVEVTVTGGADDATRRTLTIFNNDPGEAVSAVVSAVNVVDSTQSPETVQAELDDSVAATGLVGTEVKLNVQSGKSVALTIEKGARIESTGPGKELTLGSDGTTAGTLSTIKVEAGTEASESAEEVAAGKIVAAGAVTARTTDQMEINGEVQSSADNVTLTAGKYVNVATTGSITAKKNVSVTSNAGNINFYGTATSSEGNVTLTATTPDAAGQTGKSVKLGNGTDAATITATAGNVKIDGGRSAQVQNGSIVTAGGIFDALADEYVIVEGNVEAVGKVTLKTDEKQVMTADATLPAGIQIDGSVKSTGGAVELTSAGSVAVTENGEVEAKTTLDVTANGTATDTVQQGVQLAGSVSSEGKTTLKAEAGDIRQTDGSLTAAGLEATALDISQTGGHVEAAGDTALTATGTAADKGSITLAQAANDFDTVTATAVQGVQLVDADDLVLNGATAAGGAALAGDATVNAGTALTIGGPVNAGGNVSATAGDTLQINGAVTAGGDVTARSGGAMTVSQNVTAGAGKDVLLQSNADGVTVSSSVTAGNIVIAGENGGTVTLTGATLDAPNVGIRGGSIPQVTAAQLPNAQNLALESTAGGVTLEGIPVAIANIGIKATGGDIVVTAQGDRNFNGATVTAGGVTVEAGGLEAVGENAGIDVTIENGNIDVGNVTAGGNATLTATDGYVHAGDVTAGGNATVEAATDVNAGAIAANGGNATVTAQNGAVNVASVAAAGAAAVTAPGDIAATAGGIGGAGGTTVTKTGAGGAIAATGNIGQGGDTTIDANGAAINAAALASGGALTVNNAGDIEADIAAGDVATIQAGGLVAGNTETGGDLTLEIGGDADVGTLAVGGDVNGVVDGVFTTVGGQVGSIGQNGGFQAGGGVMQNGVLGSGPVTAVAGNYQLNGDLNAGGSAVNIQAGGGIQGGGVLNAGPLTLNGGGIGTAANPLTINSANLQQIAGNGIYIVDTAAGPIAINVINSTGDLDLTIQNAQVTGGGTITAGGDFTLTTSQQFGSLQNPVNVAFGGTMAVNGINAPLLHIVIDGNENPGDLSIVYTGDGFAIWGNQQKGYQIVGLGAAKQRLLDRALAFTVNTPELKSAQGIFGSPSFIHTRMNVSEARSMGNMDMLAINNTDFRGTWRTIRENADILEEEWDPPVAATGDGPLANKIESVKSEAEQQPELMPFARAVAQ